MATMWKAEIELKNGRSYTTHVMTDGNCMIDALGVILSWHSDDHVVSHLADLLTVDLANAADSLQFDSICWDDENGGFYGFRNDCRRFVALSLPQLAELAQCSGFRLRKTGGETEKKQSRANN